MPSTPFGEHLKREREMRGVSLDEIAAATKINTRFLDALENGRWNELPGGAFNRGFVRTTSRFLGLNEDDMVAEFALETSGETQNKALPETSGAMPRDFRPAVIAIVVLLLALIVGGWFTYREILLHRQRRAADAAAALAAKSVANTVAPAATSAPSSATDATVAPALPNTSVDASATTALPTPAPPLTPASPPPAPAAANINNGAPAPDVSQAAAPGKPDKLELKIDASKMADVRVVGDGKTLFKGKIHADSSKHFEARDGFEVTSSDSSAVQLELNGQNVPLDGQPGKRGSASLSRKDLKSAEDQTH